MIDTIIIIAFVLVLMLLIIYFYFRDQSIISKFEAYERAIDDLNSRVYKLEKTSDSAPSVIPPDTKAIAKELTEIENRLDAKLNDIGDPVLKTIRAIKELELNMKRLEDSVNQKYDTSTTQHVIHEQESKSSYEPTYEYETPQKNRAEAELKYQPEPEVEKKVVKKTRIHTQGTTHFDPQSESEEKIIELYKKGYSAEEIAKSQRVPLGEIELILRIANLK